MTIFYIRLVGVFMVRRALFFQARRKRTIYSFCFSVQKWMISNAQVNWSLASVKMSIDRNKIRNNGFFVSLWSFDSCKATFWLYLWCFIQIAQSTIIFCVFHSINNYRGHRNSQNDKNELEKKQQPLESDKSLIGNNKSTPLHTYMLLANENEFFLLLYILFLANQYDKWLTHNEIGEFMRSNGKRLTKQWWKQIKTKWINES